MYIAYSKVKIGYFASRKFETIWNPVFCEKNFKWNDFLNEIKYYMDQQEVQFF